MSLRLQYFWLNCKVKDLLVIKNPPTLLTKILMLVQIPWPCEHNLYIMFRLNCSSLYFLLWRWVVKQLPWFPLLTQEIELQMNYRYHTSSLTHALHKASYMGQNHTVLVLSDLWNKNPWMLWDDPSVLIAIKELENLWLERKRYQTSVINDQQNLSVAERAFNWFYQFASVCVYLCTTCAHTKCYDV